MHRLSTGVRVVRAQPGLAAGLWGSPWFAGSLQGNPYLGYLGEPCSSTRVDVLVKYLKPFLFFFLMERRQELWILDLLCSLNSCCVFQLVFATPGSVFPYMLYMQTGINFISVLFEDCSQ